MPQVAEPEIRNAGFSTLSDGGYLVVQQRINNRARTNNGYQLLIDNPGQIVQGE